ncbi:MAG TPA: hypothetical protein VEB66_06580 [Opitutaceae bacterium]|nr:hypothetical protein [Opitutaceae bacterium]
MMAATVIVFAFFGMIQALTVGSEMMATARRQTLASKMIDHEIEALRFVDWSVISGLSSSHSSNTSLVWSTSATYRVRDVVNRSGTWYRCIQNTSSQGPPNSNYWTEETPPYTLGMSSPGVAEGATYNLTHAVSNVTGLTNVREVVFTVTWTVQPSGGVASRTYTRKKTAYFGKYGLNLTLQRS